MFKKGCHSPLASTDPSRNMDFTMHHPNHHHPHYHHPRGASSSASAARCPALRAAGEHQNYQLPAASPARGSIQYDPVHSHGVNRNIWQSRTPQNWRPAAISPYSLDPMMMSTYSGPTPMNQPPQQQQQQQHQQQHQQQQQQHQPQPPLCPMPTTSNTQNVPEGYQPQIPPFQQFRTTMHPVPPRLPYQSPGAFANSNPGQSSAQHPSNRPTHRAMASLATASSTHSVPSLQLSASRPSAAQGHTGQVTPFVNENNSPGQQLPNLLPHIFTQQNNSPHFSRQTPEPIPQTAAPVQEESTGSASHSPLAAASTAAQRMNDLSNRMMNPVEIRRVSAGAMGRARRTMPRYAGSAPEWLADGAVLFRRADLEFGEGFPNPMPPDVEGPMSARFLRANGSGKRVASKKALASLLSVNIADLPESERTCVICYNDFGVANPEGINEAPLRLPKCKHVFGDHCIKKWFQESDSCPYCRDKVHSEFQVIPPRRNHPHPGFRFTPPYQIPTQHLPGYQGHDQNQSRDRDAMESESSTQSSQPTTNSTTGRPTNQFSDIGTSNRSPLGNRRLENNSHSVRMSPWNTYERRSPPIDFNHRRRSRHRVRVNSPPSRPSVFGGVTSFGASQTSVRPSRSSRSRSPFDPTSIGLDSSNRRSLTSSPEQYHWNGSPSPNSNQTGAATGGTVFDTSNFALHSRMAVTADEFFHGLVSPNLDMPPNNEHPSELPQIRSEPANFSSPSPESSEIYVPNSSSNQFTSYQHS